MRHKAKNKAAKKIPAAKPVKPAPMTNAERHRRQHERGSDTAVATYAWTTSADRVACERDLQKFCDTYLRGRFPLPSSDDQRESIEKIQHAALTGGQFAQSAPRGDGKTQRAIAGALWAALYGHRRYIVPIGATAERGKSLVRECIQELADNDLLARDWPEICLPIRKAYAKPNRAKYLTVNGEDARLESGVAKLVFPSVECCLDRPRPIAGIVVEGAGITAAFRGLRHTTANGETIRPELAILDDVQTRKSAMSVMQTERVMQILRGDIKRLAGPDKELAVVCNCTVVRRGDAADQLLDNKLNPQWRGVRKKMVYEWPKRRDLWNDYTQRRKSGLLAGDSGRDANGFYREHRESMDEGARVGWLHRYRVETGEVSALQCAYNILIDDGEEAFAAECQNEPLEKTYVVSEITAPVVLSRLNHLAPATHNPLAKCATAFIDVNRRGLYWAACWWVPHPTGLTGGVMGYGWHPGPGTPIWDEKNPKGETEEQAIFRNLAELDQLLTRPGAFSMPLQSILIDVGWQGHEANSKAVFLFLGHAHHTLKKPQYGGSRGRAAKDFKFPVEAERFEFAFFETWENKGTVLVHDADWHQLCVQRAFAAENGSPGSLSLFGESAAVHREFAQGIASKKLTFHSPSPNPARSGVYEWERVPAQKHEPLDAVIGCRVAACWWVARIGARMPAIANANAQPAPATTAQPAATDPQRPTNPAGSVSYEQGFGGDLW